MTADNTPKTTSQSKPTACYHCGDPCPPDTPVRDGKHFCCTGCEQVHLLLAEHQLTGYYRLPERARRPVRSSASYDWLKDPDVVRQLLEFQEANRCRIRLRLPTIHCTSCIWLIENSPKLLDGILSSQVNFGRREASIVYDPSLVSLYEIVQLFDKLGYAPELQLQDLDQPDQPPVNRRLLYQLGLAGFCFGNIMLLSFPEYLGIDQGGDDRLPVLMSYLSLALALPLLLYAGSDYFQAAWTSLKAGRPGVDIPIAIGMLVLFGRSAYEILSQTGGGYLDSLAGFIFFLLVGRWVQHRTYAHISFDRDYRSYFPIAAHRLDAQGKTRSVALPQLQTGDQLLVRHGELIPGDARQLSEQSTIDYSFVTGEALAVRREAGDQLYAGGRVVGPALQLELLKPPAQSYLIQLWNEQNRQEKPRLSSWVDRVSSYFTLVILTIALGTLLYWLPQNSSMAFVATTAVLIVACPCALALAIPFTYGQVIRLLSRRGFFLRGTDVVERFQEVDAVVLDKTGTITDTQGAALTYDGQQLSPQESRDLLQLARQSNHPLSRLIGQWLEQQGIQAPLDAPEDYAEVVGQGIEGTVSGTHYRIGRATFVSETEVADATAASVHWGRNGQHIGSFQLSVAFREGFRRSLDYLREWGEVYLVSGDTDQSAASLSSYFQADDMFFRQDPFHKQAFIDRLQKDGRQVMMIGDGLNDAGALQAAHVGIAISARSGHFAPACDGILDAAQFARLPRYLQFIRSSRRLLNGVFVLAILYNTIGLLFAVQGLLSPVVAAILMPVSSLSVVILGTAGANWLGRRLPPKNSHSEPVAGMPHSDLV